MKKFLTIILALVMSVSMATFLVACNDGEHTHTYATDWTSDGTHHWHAATCEHASEISEKAEHNWGIDGKCTICQKVKPNDGGGNNSGDDDQQTTHFTQATTIAGAIDILEQQGYQAQDLTQSGQLAGFAVAIGLLEAVCDDGTETEDIEAVLFDTEESATAYMTNNQQVVLQAGLVQFGRWVYSARTYPSQPAEPAYTVTEDQWITALEYFFDGNYYAVITTDNDTESALEIAQYNGVFGLEKSDENDCFLQYFIFDDNTLTVTQYQAWGDGWIAHEPYTYPNETQYLTTRNHYTLYTYALGNKVSTTLNGTTKTLAEMYSAFTYDEDKEQYSATLYFNGVQEMVCTYKFENGKLVWCGNANVDAPTTYTREVEIIYDGFEVVIPDEALNAKS